MAMEYPFEHPVTLFQSLEMPVNTQISSQTLLPLGKVLMAIAGADDQLSVWERGWLSAFMSAYNAPEAVLEVLDDYDYHGVDVKPLLMPLLGGRYERWIRRSLVQGAIRMSQADELVPSEQSAIYRAAALVGMSEAVVSEIHSLTDIFDATTSTIAHLVAISPTGEADTNMGEWDDNQPPTPERLIFGQEQTAYAQVLLYVLGADGEVSELEMEAFVGHMRRWGATEEQVTILRGFDYSAPTAASLLQHIDSDERTLNALASVALRLAGVDGLAVEEQNALVKLYRASGASIMTLRAIEGLESVRRLALTRLEALFESYI